MAVDGSGIAAASAAHSLVVVIIIVVVGVLLAVGLDGTHRSHQFLAGAVIATSIVVV